MEKLINKIEVIHSKETLTLGLKNNKMNTNQDNYKWGLFYFDPKDSRVIVPKVNRYLGWTFNFASPITYIIVIAFISLLIFFG